MRLLAVYRDVSMSAARMREIAQDHRLVCVHQECINWDVNEALTDCFSVIARADSRWAPATAPVLNLRFRREMESAASARRIGSTARPG